MKQRWHVKMKNRIPAIDFIDLAAEHDHLYPHKRQFAPEFSQQAYQTMLHAEFALGDYIEFNGS